MKVSQTQFILIASLLCCFIFTSSLTQAIAANMASVNGDNVNLRSGPGKDYSVQWEYGTGFPLRVLSHKGQWVKVRDFEHDTGWINSQYLSQSPHVIVQANRNTKRKINIRSGPTTKSAIVGKAFYGVVFETLKKKDGWAKVRHESGLEGWIKMTLLWGF